MVNDYVIVEDKVCIYIPYKSTKTGETKVHLCWIHISDFERVINSKITYSSSGNGYAVITFTDTDEEGNETKKRLLLHRYLMNPDDSMVVHHKNHNGLDNTRDNLRECAQVDNLRSKKKYKKKSGSQYKGVYPYPHGDNKWISKITVNGKNRIVGYFKDEEEAGRAYDQAALEAFGQFAELNFPIKN